MQKALQTLATAFVASAGLVTGLPVHAQGMTANLGAMGQPSPQHRAYQDQTRRNDRAGWHVDSGNSRSGRSFDQDVQQNSTLLGQPRQNQNGYDQYQNFDPNEVYLPTQISPRSVQCPVNTYGVRNPGFMATVAVADANTCRPIVRATGSRDKIQIDDYGYQGRGGHQYMLYTNGGQVTAVTLDGRVQLPPQFGEALLDRPLAGIEMDRTGMQGPQRAELKSVRNWAFGF